MADTKISALPSGAPALATDELVIARSNNNYKLTVSDVAPSIGGTISSGTAGSVLFVGTGPVFAQDSTNFTFDNTNDILRVSKLQFSSAHGSTYYFQGYSNGWQWSSNGVAVLGFVNSAFGLGSTGRITWGSTQDWTSTSDLAMKRYAAKQLLIAGDDVGATTNAGWILGYAGVSGASALYGSTAAPSASNHVLYLDGTNVTLNAPSGNVNFTIGGGGTTKMVLGNTAGLGPAITAGTATTDVNALSVTQTWNNAAVAFTGIKANVTNTASSGSSSLMDLQIGGVSQFKVNLVGGAITTSQGITQQLPNNNTNLVLRHYTPNGGLSNLQGMEFYTYYGQINWLNNVGSPIGRLQLEGASAYGFANSTNAQSLRVYKTYTDSSNYARLAINDNQIASEAAGTGTLEVTTSRPILNLAQTWNEGSTAFTAIKANVTNTASLASSKLIDLQVGGSSVFQVQRDGTTTIAGSSTTTINSGGSVIIPSGARYYFSGRVNLASSGTTVLQLFDSAETGGATMEFVEMTAPAAPAANKVRIFAQDNGAGKTQLMAIFGSGAAQQIAIEP